MGNLAVTAKSTEICIRWIRKTVTHTSRLTTAQHVLAVSCSVCVRACVRVCVCRCVGVCACVHLFSHACVRMIACVRACARTESTWSQRCDCLSTSNVAFVFK